MTSGDRELRGCEKCEPFEFCAGIHNSQQRYRAQSESAGPRAGNCNALRHRVCSNCCAFHSLPPTRTDVPLARRFRSGLSICVLNRVHGGREPTHFFTSAYRELPERAYTSGPGGPANGDSRGCGTPRRMPVSQSHRTETPATHPVLNETRPRGLAPAAALSKEKRRTNLSQIRSERSATNFSRLRKDLEENSRTFSIYFQPCSTGSPLGVDWTTPLRTGIAGGPLP